MRDSQVCCDLVSREAKILLISTSTVVMFRFYSYYYRYGTAKSAHLRSKEEYKSGPNNAQANEKPTPAHPTVPLTQDEPTIRQLRPGTADTRSRPESRNNV